MAGEDDVLGEVGVAFIVVKAGATPPSLELVRRHVASNLADYKAPDAVVVLEELPLTAMGKVDKRALKGAADDAARARAAEVRHRRSQDGR